MFDAIVSMEILQLLSYRWYLMITTDTTRKEHFQCELLLEQIQMEIEDH